MNEFYWMITIGNISEFLTIVSVFILSASIIVFIIFNIQIFADGEKMDDDFKHCLRKIKWTIIISAIVCFSTCFIPNRKQLYTIYGVGATIDYIKQNDTAKQLPDKAIKALDKLLEEVNK